jgi:hypothetical protein
MKFMIVCVLLLLVAVLYIGSRTYEKFENALNLPENTSLPEKPYSIDAINDVDDYELSSIFQHEGTKKASKKQINDAMTRYPIDWAVQGPNSQHYQEQQGKEEEKPMMEGFDDKDDSQKLLPDIQALDDEEKKILQTYKPESSKGLLSYSVEDVKHLLEKLYYRKGLIPVVEKSSQGPNIWEIVEVKERHPKIVWEGEDATGASNRREGEDASQGENITDKRDNQRNRGEELIEVPYTVSDISAGLDPFYQPRQSVRNGKFEYTDWTPGLQRMFAPTYPLKSWA